MIADGPKGPLSGPTFWSGLETPEGPNGKKSRDGELRSEDMIGAGGNFEEIIVCEGLRKDYFL